MGDVMDSTLCLLIKGTHTERKGNAPTGLISSIVDFFCPCKKTLQKAKKLFKVSLLSLSKDSFVVFGKTSLSASSFSSSTVICVKISNTD